MKQFDNKQNELLEESQPIENIEIQHDMDDHDMLLQHVTQNDHELYAIDCALCDILGT